MTTKDPIHHDEIKSSVSSRIFYIAGIITVVYGLEELPNPCRSVSCLWLLHPRLQTKEIMAPVASASITEWNSRPSSDQVGFIAVSFDQRNHGSREVSPLANQSWKKGNERHAVVDLPCYFIDMFGIFNGTAVDTSLLIDNLGSYIFNKSGDPEINQHLVLGVSLGGHAAWQVIMNDERVTIGVVIIGCPDYARLMSNRARLSHRETAGPKFLGSEDFPHALVKSVGKYDPKGIFFGSDEVQTNPTGNQQKVLREIFDSKLKGKQILCCFGEEDKLVPYHCSKPFLDFLGIAIEAWYKDGDVHVENQFYPDTGHEFSDDMLKESVKFLNKSISDSAGKSNVKL